MLLLFSGLFCGPVQKNQITMGHEPPSALCQVCVCRGVGLHGGALHCGEEGERVWDMTRDFLPSNGECAREQ